jgi:hypothetical protein
MFYSFALKQNYHTFALAKIEEDSELSWYSIPLCGRIVG